jgi:hypothetical protein
MTKTFKTQMSAALIALTFCAVAAPASAEDNLPTRAASALSAVIASQGNAALVQIREELKDNLRERLAPYLPRPEVAADAKSGDAEDRKS